MITFGFVGLGSLWRVWGAINWIDVFDNVAFWDIIQRRKFISRFRQDDSLSGSIPVPIGESLNMGKKKQREIGK